MRFVNLIYKKINKKAFFIAFFLFIFFVVVGDFVYAKEGDAGLSWWQEGLLITLAQIIYVPVWIIGLLIGQVMGFFISAAQYNDFIGAAPVLVGWEIIRDLCNMGFIIILLIIAIGSILRIESYSYRNWLPKLVIMAVLINFSKAICGIVIDVSQIVMLTFVSGIAEIGMGNFAEMMGLKDFLNFSEWKETLSGSDKEISALSIAGTMILALVFSIIALVVITAITLVIVIRIAALWILVILSPFAFLFSASPAGNKYASQWVQNFTKWVFTGPVLAFFIWLSFKTVQGASSAIFHPEGNILETSGVQVGLASIGSAEVMGTFILAIVMLMASLIVAQQLGGMAATVAGGAYRSITSRGDRIVKGTIGGVRGGADWVNRKQAGGFKAFGHYFKGTGQDLNLVRRGAILKAGSDKAKRDDIDKITDRASVLGEGSEGFKRYFLSSGSKDWYQQHVTGFLGLGGVARAARTSFKPVKIDIEKKEKAKKLEKELLGQRKKMYYKDDWKENKGKMETKREKAEEKINYYNTQNIGLTESLDKIAENIKTKKGDDGKDLSNRDINELAKTQERLEKTLDKNKKELEGHKNIFTNTSNQLGEHKKIKEEGNVFETKDKFKEERNKVNDQIKEQQNVIEKANENIAKYSVFNVEAQKDRRAKQREEGSKLNSDNSDELIEIFRNAVARDERDRASAVMIKLAQNVDTNEILEAYGYNTNIGLTEEEKNGLEREGKFEEIERRRGLHDFMRDIMKDKLEMDEQLVYSLESELGGIHKMTNQTLYSDAVSVKNGEYKQNDSATQQMMADIHLNKQDKETVIRRAPRFVYGGERISDGKFIVSESGLDFITANYASMNKEIKERGRFNPMNAMKLAEDENMKILRRATKRVSKANRGDYEAMLDNLEEYADTLRKAGSADYDVKDRMKNLGKIISNESDEINNNDIGKKEQNSKREEKKGSDSDSNEEKNNENN